MGALIGALIGALNGEEPIDLIRRDLGLAATGPHSMNYLPIRWPSSPRFVAKCDPLATKGPDHTLGLCTLCRWLPTAEIERAGDNSDFAQYSDLGPCIPPVPRIPPIRFAALGLLLHGNGAAPPLSGRSYEGPCMPCHSVTWPSGVDAWPCKPDGHAVPCKR